MRSLVRLARLAGGRHAHRGREDRGTTLTEVMLAGSLGVVVAAATIGVFIASVRTLRGVTVRTAQTADSRIALNELTRELRVAAPLRNNVSALANATSSEITFYALLDRTGATKAADADVAPTKVTYTYNNNCLWVTYTPMVLNAGSTAWLTSTPVSTAKCLLRTTVAPQFAYYTTGVIGGGGQVTAPLSAAQWISVRSIEITVTANDPTTSGAVTATPVRTRVSLSNVLNGVIA
jgi:type II secretory pathway component PulJ